MKIFGDRKGFTLVELCVVLAVSAVIGTMITTFMLFAFDQQAQITKDAKRIQETTEVQKTVNAFIKKYDSGNYTISLFQSNLIAKNTSQQKVGELSFSTTTGKISEDSTPITDKLENVSNITFSVLSGKNAVKVTVNYRGGGTQNLIFPLFSNTTRSRRVENRS